MHREVTVQHTAVVARADRARARRMMAPRVVPDIVGQRRVTVDGGAGQFFLRDDTGVDKRLRHSTHLRDGFDHRLQIPALLVVAFFEIVKVDQRRVPRIGRTQTDGACAISRVGFEHGPGQIVRARSQQRGKPWEVTFEARHQRHAEDVRIGARLAGTVHQCDRGAVRRIHATAIGLPAPPQWIVSFEPRAIQHPPRRRHAVRDRDFVAVLQIAADAWQVDTHGDAVLAQFGGRTDAGQQQQLRRVERAAAQDDFAARHGLHGRRGDVTRLRMGAIQAGALQVFDSARRALGVEQYAGDQRVEFDVQPFGQACRHVLHPFPRADAAVAARGERRVADAFEALAVALSGVGVAVTPEPARETCQRFRQAAGDRCPRVDDQPQQCGIADRVQRHRALRAQPAPPTVAAAVKAERAQRPRQRPVLAILQALGVAAHALGAPRRIARGGRDRVPVRIVRQHEDHRVVRRAAAECRGPWIEHRAIARLGVARLLRGIGVVAHAEVPAQRRVLARAQVKRRHVVIIGQARLIGGAGVAAGLQQQHPHAGLGQPRRECAAPRTGTDHDVVPARGRAARVHRGCRQNVFKNAISARLSMSLNTGSVPNARSSALRPSCSLNCAVPK